MQFLFGKNKDNKYGIIYTDAHASDAEALKSKIELPIDTETNVYGYVNCASGMPLFFRVAKDESLEKSAYFIHGISRKAIPEYYSSNEFEADIFTRFADKDAIAASRSGEGKPIVSADQNLSSEMVEINEEIIKEMLVRLYQGESLLMSVPDDIYNGDYARCALAKLYSYMPPSLKKSCGYIVGMADIGKMQGIKLKIVPESMLKHTIESYYDLSVDAHKCIAESYVLSMINTIMKADEIERERIFAGYECIFGVINYKPQHFFDFWEAYCGNAVIAERLFDAYLSVRKNPVKEDTPRFIVSALAEKYRTESALSGIIKISSIQELASPDKILAKYEKEIKKLYLLYPAPTHFISAVYSNAFKALTLKDSDIDLLTEAIKTFASRTKGPLARYKECFETAVETAFTDFTNNRLSKCVDLRQRVNLYVERTFAKLPQQAIEENEILKVRTAFEQNIAAAVQEAINHGFDLNSTFAIVFDKSLKAHNEKYRPAVTLDLAKLDAVSRVLASKNVAVSDKDILDIVEAFADYPAVVDTYVAKYALKKKIFPRLKNNVIFTELSTKKNRLVNVSELMAEYDPLSALYLLACYAPVTEAYEGMEKLINSSPELFNSLNAGKVRKDINNIGEMLFQRMSEDDVNPEDIQVILDKYSESNKNQKGVCKLIVIALRSAYKAYNKGGSFAPKMNTNPLWAIFYVLLAAAIVAGGIFLAKKFIIGRDWNLFGGDSSESSAVVDTNSPSNDDSSTSSEASSDTSSDTSSDVSSEASSDVSSDTSSDISSDASSDTSSDDTPVDSNIKGFETVGNDIYIEYFNINVNDSHVIGIDGYDENARYAGNSGTWEYCLLLKPVENHQGYYQVEQTLNNVTGIKLLFNKSIEDFENNGYIVIAFHLKKDTTAADDEDYNTRLADAKLIGNGDYVLMGAYDSSIKQLQPITATFHEVTPIYEQ